MKFTEAQLEQVFLDVLQEQNMQYVPGNAARNLSFEGVNEPPMQYDHVVSEQVLLKEDLYAYLLAQYMLLKALPVVKLILSFGS